MEQEKTWMHYLLVGISYIFLIVQASCGPEDKDCLVKSNFIFVNESDFKIDMGIGVIPKNESLILDYNNTGSCNLDPIEFATPFQTTNTFILNDTLCKTFEQTSPKQGEGPFGISNYMIKKIANSDFKFTYVFKNEDFAGRVDCE